MALAEQNNRSGYLAAVGFSLAASSLLLVGSAKAQTGVTTTSQYTRTVVTPGNTSIPGLMGRNILPPAHIGMPGVGPDLSGTGTFGVPLKSYQAVSPTGQQLPYQLQLVPNMGGPGFKPIVTDMHGVPQHSGSYPDFDKVPCVLDSHGHIVQVKVNQQNRFQIEAIEDVNLNVKDKLSVVTSQTATGGMAQAQVRIRELRAQGVRISETELLNIGSFYGLSVTDFEGLSGVANGYPPPGTPTPQVVYRGNPPPPPHVIKQQVRVAVNHASTIQLPEEACAAYDTYHATLMPHWNNLTEKEARSDTFLWQMCKRVDEREMNWWSAYNTGYYDTIVTKLNGIDNFFQNTVKTWFEKHTADATSSPDNNEPVVTANTGDNTPPSSGPTNTTTPTANNPSPTIPSTMARTGETPATMAITSVPSGVNGKSLGVLAGLLVAAAGSVGLAELLRRRRSGPGPATPPVNPGPNDDGPRGGGYRRMFVIPHPWASMPLARFPLPSLSRWFNRPSFAQALVQDNGIVAQSPVDPIVAGLDTPVSMLAARSLEPNTDGALIIPPIGSQNDPKFQAAKENSHGDILSKALNGEIAGLKDGISYQLGGKALDLRIKLVTEGDKQFLLVRETHGKKLAGEMKISLKGENVLLEADRLNTDEKRTMIKFTKRILQSYADNGTGTMGLWGKVRELNPDESLKATPAKSAAASFKAAKIVAGNPFQGLPVSDDVAVLDDYRKTKTGRRDFIRRIDPQALRA